MMFNWKNRTEQKDRTERLGKKEQEQKDLAEALVLEWNGTISKKLVCNHALYIEPRPEKFYGFRYNY